MNILHIIPGLTVERGGPSAVVNALTRHQIGAGHRVTVLTTDQGARRGEQPITLADGVGVERIRVLGPDRMAYAPGFARRAKALLRATDVVHAHSIFTYPIHAALCEAMAVGVPVLLRPCGQLHRYSLNLSRWRKWAYLTMCGATVRKACSAWHFTSANESVESWPWDASPRFVLPNGIEPAEYEINRQEAQKRVHGSYPQIGASPYVLFLGRLHPKKRLDLLMEAFLTGAPEEFKLVVAGPDECGLWKELTDRFLSTPLAAGRVLRIGTVTGQDKLALMADARLFVLPSEHENFGIAALEALAVGTPVLLSPHVDLAEAVVAENLGYVLPLDLWVWREQLAALLGKATPLSGIGERARQWVRKHYSWDRLASQLLAHYERVLARCPFKLPGPGEVSAEEKG